MAVLSSLDYSTNQSVTTVELVTNNTVTTVNNNTVTTVTNNYYSTTSTAQAIPAATTSVAGAAVTTANPAQGVTAKPDLLLQRPGYRISFRSHQYGAGGRVDRIIGFNSEAGDQLTLHASAFPGIDKLSFRSISSRRSLRKAARSAIDILYLQSSGELFFNANGTSVGFGKDGGLFAVLEQKSALSEAQVLLA